MDCQPTPVVVAAVATVGAVIVTTRASVTVFIAALTVVKITSWAAVPEAPTRSTVTVTYHERYISKEDI